MQRSMQNVPPRICDEFPHQVVHIVLPGRGTYHVEVATDALSARCLETDHYVRGSSRADCLAAMARRLEEHCAEPPSCPTSPQRSIC